MSMKLVVIKNEKAIFNFLCFFLLSNSFSNFNETFSNLKTEFNLNESEDMIFLNLENREFDVNITSLEKTYTDIYFLKFFGILDNSEEFYVFPIENTNLEEENTELLEEEKSYFDISFILFYVSMFFNLICLILIIILFRRKI